MHAVDNCPLRCCRGCEGSHTFIQMLVLLRCGPRGSVHDAAVADVRQQTLRTSSCEMNGTEQRGSDQRGCMCHYGCALPPRACTQTKRPNKGDWQCGWAWAWAGRRPEPCVSIIIRVHANQTSEQILVSVRLYTPTNANDPYAGKQTDSKRALLHEEGCRCI